MMVAQISNPDVILVVERVLSAAKVGVFHSYNYLMMALLRLARQFEL